MMVDADHVTGLKALHWHLLSGHGFPPGKIAAIARLSG